MRITPRECAGVLLFSLLVRAAVILWGLWIAAPASFPNYRYMKVWNQWDARWYISLAEGGYRSPELKPAEQQFASRFPPIYPGLIRGTSRAFGIPAGLAGITISVLALGAASVLLYELALWEFESPNSAGWAVVFMNLYPASYFANSAYAEAVFILFTLLYFYALRVRASYEASGFWALGMVLTRAAGAAVYPFHLLALHRICRILGFRRDALIWAALPAIGFGVFAGVMMHVYHFSWYTDTANQPVLAALNPFPFSMTGGTLWQLVTDPGRLGSYDFMMRFGWPHIFLAAALAVSLAGLRTVPMMYNVYSLSYLLLAGMMAHAVSAARFTFALPPLYLVLARIPYWPLRVLLAAVFSAGLLYFSSVFVREGWAL